MSKSGSKKNNGASVSGKARKDTVDIDPSIIRYTHSRIRPYFTGCNKKLEDTIKEITDGIITVDDIPHIIIIENEGEYFSLNNRRLYTIKHIQSLGLLKNNTIQVYLKPALEREKIRYTVKRCSLQARVTGRELAEDSDNEGDSDSEGEVGEEEKIQQVQNEGIKDLVSSAESLNLKGVDVATAAVATEAKPIPPKPKEKVKVKVMPIPADIVKEYKDLTKLVAKGKTKIVLSQIDDWVMGKRITDAQREEICQIVGLPLSK